MSHERNEDVFQEPDVVPRVLLLRIAVGTIAVGLSVCVIAYLLLRAREYTLRPSLEFPEQKLPAPHRVAQVREQPFTVTHPKATPLEEQGQALERYGWTDRQRGIIHVPIEVGMDLVLREAATRKGRP